MKFKHLSLALALGLILPFSTTFAASKVANVSVSADYDYLTILWDQLSTTDFDNADGYAVQWSDRETHMQIDDSITFYQENNVDDKSLRRATFENDTYYFIRVYTYRYNENNQRILGNGSDMLKFKVNFNNEITKDTIVVTDPEVVDDSGNSVDTTDFEFGTLRKYPYDTFADFFWSTPAEMTTSDYDGFMITLSKNSDMEDPLIEAKADRSRNSLRITGLEANTTYYAQGAFYKNSSTFGDSTIRNFETIEAVPRDSSTRQSRNIIKVEDRAIETVSIDGSTTTSSSSSSTSTESTSSSSSSSTTVTTSSQSEINSASQTEIKAKIAELKKQISALQVELNRWEAKLDKGNSVSSTASSSSGLSVRERLKLILESKRNQ